MSLENLIRNIAKRYIYMKPALGQYGQPIKIYKIRTMIPNADKYQSRIILLNIFNQEKYKEDPRITWWGKILRRLKIDELPQLYHLVKEELSLIGVRPKHKETWKFYPKEFMHEALKRKPGLISVTYGDIKQQISNKAIQDTYKYWALRDNHQVRTDLKYLIKYISNFLLGRCSK